MAIVREQEAYASVGSGQSRIAQATFKNPTKSNSLVHVTVASSGGSAGLYGPFGFTADGQQILFTQVPGSERVIGDLKISVWYKEACPQITSIATQTTVDRAVQIAALEYSGVALVNALDKVSISTNQTAAPTTGQTGNTTQADVIAISSVCNLYASTTQYGFAGALTKILERESPASGWGWLGLGSDPDYLRTRLTIHQGIVNAVQNFVFSLFLTAVRPWIAIICTFKGASSGPARFTSKGQAALKVTGRGDLTVFGKFSALRRDQPNWSPAIRIDGRARMGPFAQQYRIGGWDGLTIGEGTPYRVQSIEGLGGWEMRVGDDDQPRDDGAIRGDDLQSARIITVKINAGDGEDPEDIEALLDALFRRLVPQRNQDWPFLWRDPGQPLKMIKVRPINLNRLTDLEQVLRLDQPFILRAADPRHYSAFARSIVVPNTPAGMAGASTVLVLNNGNGFAYPIIRVSPTSIPLTRVEIRNESYDVTTAIEAAMPVRSELVIDMETRATGGRGSIITIDRQPKFGAWIPKRQKFVLAPGQNYVSLKTVPAGVPVTCSIEYRDTWAG